MVAPARSRRRQASCAAGGRAGERAARGAPASGPPSAGVSPRATGRGRGGGWAEATAERGRQLCPVGPRTAEDFLLAQTLLPTSLGPGRRAPSGTAAPPSGASAPATASDDDPRGEHGADADGPTGRQPRMAAGPPDGGSSSVASTTPPAHTPAVMEQGAADRASSSRGPCGLARGRHRPGGDRQTGHVIRIASASVQAPTKAGRPPAHAAVSPPPRRRRRRVPRPPRARRQGAIKRHGPRRDRWHRRPNPASHPHRTSGSRSGSPPRRRSEERRDPRAREATSPTAGETAPAGHPPRPRGRRRGPGRGRSLTRPACAAARPHTMQAGIPTPWYAAPATATPPRRASAASMPAVRSRWCTRYCGKAPAKRTTRAPGQADHRHP